MTNKQITKQELEQIIEDRIGMQSTKRELFAAYKIKDPSLNYFHSTEFKEKLDKMVPIQKKMLISLIAGKYSRAASELFDQYFLALN